MRFLQPAGHPAGRTDGRGQPASTRLIDRYILRETAKPLAVALAVVLVALLLERMLRLFDLLATHGGSFGLVVRMAANLVPHYLGLALPAAFFIAIFVVVARFGEDNEFDALQSAGLSVGRMTRPFLWMGLALLAVSIALFGFLQPYSRYAYRAIHHAVVNAAWDASVPQNAFVDAGRGLTVTADQVDATGRDLEHVFVHQRIDGPDGATERVTTAERGRLVANPDRTRILLILEEGVQMRVAADGEAEHLRFGRLVLDRDFDLTAPPFRPRGGSERELTLVELRREMGEPASPIPAAKLASEFHARLVRAVTLPLLPLLAVPMGMAAKRARRGQGIAVAAAILVTYHHSLQLGESLADVGRIPAMAGAWVPFLLFAALCAWLYRKAESRPGQNPFGHAFDRIDRLLHASGRLVPKWVTRWRPWRRAVGG